MMEIKKKSVIYYAPTRENILRRDGEITNVTTMDEINYEFIIRRFICHCQSINANLIMLCIGQ